MPTPAYLVVEGNRQGFISQDAFTEAGVGNIYQEGYEDNILVQSIEHTMMIPTDSQSGQPASQRIHFRIGDIGMHSFPIFDISDIEDSRAVWFWQVL